MSGSRLRARLARICRHLRARWCRTVDLKSYMTVLASDPHRLGAFLVDPRGAMSAAGLDEEDRTAVASQNPLAITARLAGVSLQDALSLAPSSESFEARPESGAASRGELVVVGTGIRVVGQLTVEALAWIERADVVIYADANPIAEALIRKFNPDRAYSLMPFYGEGKDRRQTYGEWVELILAEVRSGARVCAVFYGHPGVFVDASRESIRRARQEGYRARMLPGISAEDCLLADLGIDPASGGSVTGVGGLQSFMASDFLMNVRAVDTSSHLLLWQVASLDDGAYRGTFAPRSLPLLAQKLSEWYPLSHEVVFYMAPVFANCPPVVTRLPLAALPATPVGPGDTLYIAPIGPPSRDPRYGSPGVGQGNASNPIGWLFLGQRYAARKEFSEAAESFRQAIALARTTREQYGHLIVAAHWLIGGRPSDEVLGLVLDARALDSQLPESYIIEGRLRLMRGEWHDAIRAIDAALARMQAGDLFERQHLSGGMPAYVYESEPFVVLANAYGRLGHLHEMLANIDRALTGRWPYAKSTAKVGPQETDVLCYQREYARVALSAHGSDFSVRIAQTAAFIGTIASYVTKEQRDRDLADTESDLWRQLRGGGVLEDDVFALLSEQGELVAVRPHLLGGRATKGDAA